MHVFILYLCYVFLTYMIAEGITYIFSVQNKDTEEISEATPQLEPGDIIQFIFSKNDTPDNCLNRHPARRSISTYGFEEIEPEENTDYIITCLEHNASIPNHKGRYNFDKSVNNMDTFMYVFPKKEFEEMNGMFEHTKEVFWFINLNKMTICQFEDAYPIYKISSIVKINKEL